VDESEALGALLLPTLGQSLLLLLLLVELRHSIRHSCP
jgi:hypothetical protein